MSTKSNNQNQTKQKYWTILAYPDSVPDNWKEILTETGLPFAGILHDKDVTEKGKPKKPHWHLVTAFPNTTTFNNVVSTITSKLNAPIPQGIADINGMYDYLTHKNNPEKYQYDSRELFFINGFSISNYRDITKNEIDKIKQEIQHFIIENDYIEYSQLMDWCLYNNLDWHKVASQNSNYFSKYISSRRHYKEKLEKQKEQQEYLEWREKQAEK
uniref:Plasmid replication initiation protein n=1 Tax=Mycoplasma yeatsii TaxID=51365 RepID=K9RYC6_9MOLU|nr:replication protein [Mycoplasma yeatsii]AFY63024.1 plasmid replication initiation protein [Mycoplasma yeatsii]